MSPAAIILAAGRGSRMGQLTEDLPKCLTNLSGQSLLSWQIGALKAAGIIDVSAIGGYARDILANHISLTAVNEQWSGTNMVQTLAHADHILSKQETVVSYSDIVYHPNIVTALMECDADIALTYDTLWFDLWSLRFQNPLDDAESFKEINGWVKEIGNKTHSLDNVQGQYMGLLKFTSNGWMRIKLELKKLGNTAVNQLDMTGLIRHCLTQKIAIRAVPVKGRWCEVDSEKDLNIYEKQLELAAQGSDFWCHDWRWEN